MRICNGKKMKNVRHYAKHRRAKQTHMALQEDTLQFWQHTGVDERKEATTPCAGGHCPVTRSKYEGRVKTGDLLLFSGNDLWSGFIKCMTLSDWTHVGMVVCDEQDENPQVFEMHARRGAQMVPLDHRIKSYKGIISVRPLVTELDGSQLDALYTYVDDSLSTPFKANYQHLVDSYLMYWSFNIPLMGGAFVTPDSSLPKSNGKMCTELLLNAMDSMKLRKPVLKRSKRNGTVIRSPCSYMPQDFSSSSVDDFFNETQPLCLYGKERTLS